MAFLKKKFSLSLLRRALSSLCIITLCIAPLTLSAQTSKILEKGGVSKSIEKTGLGNNTPTEVVINIISITLGILSVIAVSLIIYGGFLWMTAAGNQEQVKKAIGILKAAIIGVLIIIASWGITLYIIDTAQMATMLQPGHINSEAPDTLPLSD
ncbi:MAG TPA: pilin [Patescibacteria group bacterium]|nr:pilin [Patescibacteria group bacterium]